LEDRFPEIDNLLHEFWSQFVELHLVEFLQGVLVSQRAYECHAVPVVEGLADRHADHVADLGIAGLWAQTVF
jgi:hypothetical protein